MNFEQQLSLSTVALFTESDRQAMFVREADDAVCIGPATFLDQRDGRRKSSYLDLERIEQALIIAHADAAWVGWGLLAEESWFADLCKRLGIVFFGPNAETLGLLSNKINARQLAQRANVPVVPWSGLPIETETEAWQYAKQLGYPLMIKAAVGRGGFGIHRVSSPTELASAFKSACDTAHRSFGDSTVFLERMIDGAHHVEVQVITDNYGATWAVGVHGCTVQRHGQKILEESSSPVLSSEQERELREAAVRLCQFAGYQYAGTVQFLYDPNQHEFWFLDFNPYLSVAHPITEMTTGLDLVKLQLNLARGGRLAGEPPAPIGYAVEAHLYAEDPDNEFAPSSGRLELFRHAGGPGLRIDIGYEEGDIVHAELDPLLAKIIAWGRDRREALARLSRALAESAVIIRTGMSNKPFLLDLLNRLELAVGEVDTLWLDRLISGDVHRPRLYAGVALLQAAVEAYNVEQRAEQAGFYTSAARGRPKVRQGVDLPVDFQYLGQDYRFRVSRPGPQDYRVITDGQRIEARVEQLGPFERRITCYGRRYRAFSVIDGPNYSIEVEGIAHPMTHEEGGIIRAPAPAVVVSVAVAPGDYVEVGNLLAVVEAMKMEMAITAPFPGRIARLFVTSNVQVDPGAPLVQMAYQCIFIQKIRCAI